MRYIQIPILLALAVLIAPQMWAGRGIALLVEGIRWLRVVTISLTRSPVLTLTSHDVPSATTAG